VRNVEEKNSVQGKIGPADTGHSHPAKNGLGEITVRGEGTERSLLKTRPDPQWELFWGITYFNICGAGLGFRGKGVTREGGGKVKDDGRERRAA